MSNPQTNPKDTAAIRRVAVANPIPGVGLSSAYFAFTRKRLVSLDFRLTVDANAANRAVQVYVSDGTNNYFMTLSGYIQTAGLTRDYHFQTGRQFQDLTTTELAIVAPLSPDFQLQSADLLVINVDNMLAADQITNIRIVFETIWY